jgi:uncharacterized membrane protein
MKSALTVLASVVLALFATWYAVAARVKVLQRPPEQATILVVPAPGGGCVPRVARPVIKAHVEDVIEWRSVELPGCEGAGAFDLDSAPEHSRMFSPGLRASQPAHERTARVGAEATEGVTVTYTVALSNGQRETARITFF